MIVKETDAQVFLDGAVDENHNQLFGASTALRNKSHDEEVRGSSSTESSLRQGDHQEEQLLTLTREGEQLQKKPEEGKYCLLLWFCHVIEILPASECNSLKFKLLKR